MKRVVVFGAGLVAAPLIRNLLSHGYGVTVAALNHDRAAELVGDHPNGRAIAFDLKNTAELAKLIGDHDLSVSLLPPPCHPIVARACIDQGKTMVTTSYRSPEIRELDQEARRKGSLILMEVGADPGLDHLSLMDMVDKVRAKGGRVSGLKSLCGGLPAPGSNDNPMGYKFSWSPKGVLVAGMSEAKWRENGDTVENPAGELHRVATSFTLQGLQLERYPNRDSLAYESVYGLDGIKTLVRETLRYPGWCQTIRALSRLGWMDNAPHPKLGQSFRAFTESSLGGASLRTFIKDAGLEEEIAYRLEWLGLMDETSGSKDRAPIDALVDIAVAKMPFAPGERDMLVMHHELEFTTEDGAHLMTSTLFDYGEPHGDSAMSRTVSLPCASATRLVLVGKYQDTGVHIPLHPDLYRPALEELQASGIRFSESVSRVG